MSRVVTITDSKVLNPSSYSDYTFTTSYMRNPENGCNSTSNTTSYAMFTMRNTSYHIYYNFPDANLPSGASITSVACSVKGYVSRTNGYPSVQMYSGTTAKGSAMNITSTTTTNISSISNIGTWTASELSNARLYIAVAAKNNSTYFYFYGANLTINYTYQQTQYEVNITNNAGSVVTVDPTGQQWVNAGEDMKVSFTTNQGFTVTDNNSEVTLTAEDGRYWHIISNISADHTVIVSIPGTGVWVKVNGQWVQGTDIKVKYGDRWRSISEVYVFKEEEGGWIQAEHGVKDIFDTHAVFLKG